MTTHRFIATAWHNVLGTLAPALTVASGDTVITETIDAHGIDKDGVQRAPEPNPMNGPISVTGAEPGDALKVDEAALVEAEHAIGGLDGAQAVGDDEGGAVLEQLVHRALDA